MSHRSLRDGLSLPWEPLGEAEWRARREALLQLSTATASASLEQIAALLAHGRLRRWGIHPESVVRVAERPVLDPASLSPHGLLLRAAADGAGWSTDVLPPDRLGLAHEVGATLRIATGRAVFDYRRQQLFFAGPGGGSSINGPMAQSLFLKHEGKSVIAAAGGAPPSGEVFERGQVSAALAYAAGLRAEVCVKPNAGANGHRVFPRLREADEIAEAIVATAAIYDRIVVEESLPGEAWRVFYVAPDIVGVKVARLPAVVGDGVRSVEALIREEDNRRAARAGSGPAKRLAAGLMRDWMLRRQGVSPDSVVEVGRRIFLSPCSNGSQGAESLAWPGLLDARYVDALKRMFQAIPGLKVGAADVMVTMPAQFVPDGFRVLEINMAPSLLAYHFPAEGKVQDVSGAMIRLLNNL